VYELPKAILHFKVIMKDKWINMGHEEDELKPFIEPKLDVTDEKRIDLLVSKLVLLFLWSFLSY